MSAEAEGPNPEGRRARTVSFEPETDKQETVPLQGMPPKDEVEAEAEDIVPPLPSEKTPGIFAKRAEGGIGRSVSTIATMRKISTSFSTVSPHDENQEKGNWNNPIEFILSILGFCIGLGNIWRFPVLCYNNGGGAFLIPYFTMLFGCGLPLILMEMTLGQYSSEALLTVWKVSPLFKGLGIGMIIITVMVGVYYNMITGWSLYYFFMSLRAKLPWQCCESPWRSKDCVTFEPESCGENMTTYVTPTFGNGSTAKFAADDYFHNGVLKISGDIASIGSIQWPMAVALFVAWLIVFLVLCKGIKSLGKTAYFTSTFPFLILLLLLIRAVIEPGALNGIKYFLTPKWHLLKNAKIWSDAASQIFFTTGACQGGVITLASYNRFKNNLYRDAYVMVFGNCIVSFFSGLVCFSILGFMAYSQNAEIDDVITSGPGLTFIIYPQAVTILPISPLWSALFFFMLTTLAFSSMFPTVEIVTTSLTDQFQVLRQFKWFVTMGSCILMFLLGLPLCTNGGMYILELLNTWGVGYSLLFLGLIETAVICWRYGAGRLMKNVKHMRDRSPIIILKYMWLVVSPGLLIFAITFTCIKFSPSTYGDYIFPLWANLIGFVLILICLSPIPIYAVYKIISYQKKLRETGRSMSILKTVQVLTLPTEGWGPALKVYQSPGIVSPQKRRAFSAFT